MFYRKFDPGDKFLLNLANQDIAATKLAMMRKKLALPIYILMPLIVVGLIVAMALMLEETIHMARLFFQGRDTLVGGYHISTLGSTGTFDYSFVVIINGKPQAFEGSQTITTEIAEKITSGYKTPRIHYLPDDPTTNAYIDDPQPIYVRTGSSFLGLLLIPLLTYLTIRYFLSYYRLYQKNQQIQGRVVIGTIEHISGIYQGSDFVVTVDYLARPFRRKLKGQASAVRNDLKPEQLPAPDTKVYVLVRSKKERQVL